MKIPLFSKKQEAGVPKQEKSSHERKTEHHDFVTHNNFELLGAQIKTGVAKSKESSVGMKFLVIEPALNSKEKVAFDIIKKLLMTEMTVSISGIKDQEQAQKRLKSKITRMSKEYNLNIPQKSLDKIIYYSLQIGRAHV